MQAISKPDVSKDLDSTAHEFLELASLQRLEILSRLYQNRSKVSTVAKELDATVPEVYRNFERLAKVNMISKEPEGDYSITTYGRIVYSQIPILQFLTGNKKYFQEHGLGDIPSKFLQRMGALAQTRHIKGFVKVMEKWKEIYQYAESYLSNILVEIPYSSDIVEPLISKLTEGIKLRSIISESSIVPAERKKIIDTPSFKKLFAEGKIERKMKKQISVVLISSEKEACIMFPKKSGEADISDGFYGNDPAFLEWCSDYFEYCWMASRPFQESKLES